MGYTGDMKYPHLWVISFAILSYHFLTFGPVCIVLVLDQSSIQCRTLSRTAYLDVASIIYFGGGVFSTVSMGKGPLVSWWEVV